MNSQIFKSFIVSRPISLLFLLLIFIVSCQSVRNTPQSISSNDTDNFQNSKSFVEKRKIITSVNMTLEVINVDTVNRQISSIFNNIEGYAAETGTEQTIIRVNADQLDAILTKLSGLGKVKEKNVYGRDVTDDYRDNEIRLENAEKSRNRYLELLKKANTVEEILLVEKELERLNEVIDLIKGRLNRLSHLSEFATITIDWEVKKKPGLIGYVFIGAYKSVRWLFVRD